MYCCGRHSAPRTIARVSTVRVLSPFFSCRRYTPVRYVRAYPAGVTPEGENCHPREKSFSFLSSTPVRHLCNHRVLEKMACGVRRAHATAVCVRWLVYTYPSPSTRTTRHQHHICKKQKKKSLKRTAKTKNKNTQDRAVSYSSTAVSESLPVVPCSGRGVRNLGEHPSSGRVQAEL